MISVNYFEDNIEPRMFTYGLNDREMYKVFFGGESSLITGPKSSILHYKLSYFDAIYTNKELYFSCRLKPTRKLNLNV